MTKARSLRLASLLFTAAAFGAGLFALPSVASAERYRVRVGGDVHVRARGHVRIGGPRTGSTARATGPPRYRRHYRPHFRPRLYVRPYARPYVYYPGVYWGYRYAAPPPPACYEACGPSASAYYQAPPQPVAVGHVIERDPLPRLGIGVFGGSVDTENNEAGSDIGLVGRVRLTRHFLLEAEVAKSELDDGSRVDRRLGGSLLFDFLPYSDFSALRARRRRVRPDRRGRRHLHRPAGLRRARRRPRVGARPPHHACSVTSVPALAPTRPTTRRVTLAPARAVLERRRTRERFTRARIGALLYF